MPDETNSTNTNNRKFWWAPVWSGLVMDQDGKHYKIIRNTLWLYLYFLLNADRRSGTLARKIRTISSDMGVSRTTIIRGLNTLRRGGYITTEKTSRSLLIHIRKWKTLPQVSEVRRERYQRCYISGIRNDTSKSASESQNLSKVSEIMKGASYPNDISINNIYNNDRIDSVDKNHLRPDLKSVQGFKQETSKQHLALELAYALDDQVGLPLYISYVYKYPETLLKEVLRQVQKIPSSKIKKSRGALFNYLVQKLGKNT